MLTMPGCEPCGGWKTGSEGTTKSMTEGFTAYPSPASEQLTIRFANAEESSTLRLFNMTGQLLRQINSQQQQQVVLDVANLPAGTYLLQATTTTGSHTRLIEVQ